MPGLRKRSRLTRPVTGCLAAVGFRVGNIFIVALRNVSCRYDERGPGIDNHRLVDTFRNQTTRVRNPAHVDLPVAPFSHRSKHERVALEQEYSCHQWLTRFVPERSRT
jgi:hypothetical protein